MPARRAGARVTNGRHGERPAQPPEGDGPNGTRKPGRVAPWAYGRARGASYATLRKGTAGT
eukprot:1133678-Lingulodinium_polyedra.AAC.1